MHRPQLTKDQESVLLFLHRCKSGTVEEICDGLKMQKEHVELILAQLEKKGLIH